MKEATLSICERNFILNAAAEAKRLDGRKLDEFRNLNIYFGNTWGLCYTSLGETRVVTQVKCEVQQPKTTKPNEGLLYINVEVSSMAAAHFEPGRTSDIYTHLNRLLEKCIKDSKAVDLESLCLVAEEKAWALKVNVSILNHDGNLVQAASISSIAALAHFRRPDVTTNGEEITIHDISERDPIPLTLFHYPVCITYALLNNGENVLADPTSVEERISDASLIFGINAYGEICALHLGGSALVEPALILKYSQRAALKARETVETIKQALIKDTEARQSERDYGLVESIHWDKIKSLSDSRLKVQLKKFKLDSVEMVKDDGSDIHMEENGVKAEVIDLGDNCAELVSLQGKEPENSHVFTEEPPGSFTPNREKVIQLTNVWDVEKFGEGGPSKWELDSNSKHQPMEDSGACKSKDDVVFVGAKPKNIEKIDLSGESEEEVMILEARDIENPAATSKPTKPNPKFHNKNRGNYTSETRSDQHRNIKRKNRRRKN